MAAMAIAGSATSAVSSAPAGWKLPSAYFNAGPMLFAKRSKSRRTVAQDKRAALKRRNRKR
jgi:hypothetical protein